MQPPNFNNLHITDLSTDLLIPIFEFVEDPPKIKEVCKLWYKHGNALYKHLFAHLGFHLHDEEQNNKKPYILKDLIFKIFDPDSRDQSFLAYGNEYKRGSASFYSFFENMWKKANHFHGNTLMVCRVPSIEISEKFHPCCVYVHPSTGFKKEYAFCKLTGERNDYNLVSSIIFDDRLPIGRMAINGLQRQNLFIGLGEKITFTVLDVNDIEKAEVVSIRVKNSCKHKPFPKIDQIISAFFQTCVGYTLNAQHSKMPLHVNEDHLVEINITDITTHIGAADFALLASNTICHAELVEEPAKHSKFMVHNFDSPSFNS